MQLRRNGAETAIVGARLSGRPREVWTLGALDLVAAVAVLAAAVAPATMHHFFRVGLVCGLLLLAAAIVVYVVGVRLGRVGLVVAVVVQVGILSAVVAESLTAQGAMLASLTFVWSAVYAASFFTRRDLFIVLLAAAAGSGAALSLSGVSRWVGFWVVLTLTTSTTGIVLERSVEQLRHDADTDALTGLLNRRGFSKAADVARSISARAGLVVALVVIDLDNFKAVNDADGHAAGDRALREATAAWKAQLRSGDLLARFGGDEFVVLLPGLSSPEVGRLIERCHAAHPIAWTAGAAFVEPEEPIEAALERADRLLYGAKLKSDGVRLSS